MIQSVCHFFCKKRGWKLINKVPKELKQGVGIGFPHTSNWDFPTAMFTIKESKIDAKFAIKKEWMKFPLGFFLKSIGAIGIDRSSRFTKSTQALANLFKKYDKLFLLIAPEGTRSKREKWKSGFYYTATEANVPIFTLKANYEEKTIYLGELIIYPTDFENDMKKIMNYFEDAKGHTPSNSSLDLRFK